MDQTRSRLENLENETPEIKAGGLYHCLGGVSRIHFNFVSVRSSDGFRDEFVINHAENNKPRVVQFTINLKLKRIWWNIFCASSLLMTPGIFRISSRFHSELVPESACT